MVIHQFNRLIKNKWVWGVFAVSISVFFAFDFLFVGGGDEGSSSRNAGKLGGEDFPMAQFRSLVDDVRGFGRRRDTRSSNAEVNRQVWQRAAALKVAQDLHLEATDADIAAVINRQFRDSNGDFNREAYERWLRENGFTPELFEQLLKRNMTLDRLGTVIGSSAAWVSPMEVNEALYERTDKFTVRVAAFTDKNAGKVTLDDKGLQAYYNEHTNSIALPDCAVIRYAKIMADTPARLAQFKISEDDMRERYDADQDRFKTMGTNGVMTTKSFDEVKGILEHELRVDASVEAYCTNLLSRITPQDSATVVDDKTDHLAEIAAAEKATVVTSKPFSLDGRVFVKGFMGRPSEIAPDSQDFVEKVSELDSIAADLRYGVAQGTNCVYLIERLKDVKARVPTFAEAKEVIRPDALADARAKAFKAAVEKTRALVAADLAKGKPFDAKAWTDASVSTQIVFSVSSLQANAFPDARDVAFSAMKLEKGQLSDFIPTGDPARALVVYMVNREPGDAAQAQTMRPQLGYAFARREAATLPSAWLEWNLNRLGFKPTDATSVKDDDASADHED